MAIKYSSPTGNDSTGDGTIGNPWRTVQKLLSNLAAGDTGYLRAGTYVENCQFVTGGTSEATRVKLATNPGDTRATINGIIYQPNTLAYNTVENIHMLAHDTTSGLIMQMYGDHARVTNCDVDGNNLDVAGGVGVGFTGHRSVGQEIDHNRIHNFGASSNIFYHGIYADNCDGAAIHDNYIFDNIGGYGITTWTSCLNCRIHHNTFDGNGGNIQITGQNPNPTSSCEFDHNIMSNPARTPTFYNTNIFWGNYSGDHSNAGTGNTVHDNLYFNGQLDPGTAYGADVGVVYTNNLNTDPLYTNRSAKDFTTSYAASGYGVGGATGGGGGGGSGVITFGVSAAATNNPTATTIAVLLGTVAVDDVVVVAVSWGHFAGDLAPTVTDNLGNTYTALDGQVDAVDGQGLWTFYSKITNAGSATITATHSVSRTFQRISAASYTGVDTTTPIDQNGMNAVATASTVADAVVSPTKTTTRDGAMIVGAVMDTSGSSTIAPGTGYTERNDAGALELEDKSQATAGSVTATWTFSVADQYVAGIVCLKPALAAGGGGGAGAACSVGFVPFILNQRRSRVQV